VKIAGEARIVWSPKRLFAYLNPLLIQALNFSAQSIVDICSTSFVMPSKILLDEDPRSII